MRALVKNALGLFVTTLLFIGSLHAQAPDTLWTRMFGSQGSEYGACVHQTGDEGYIITGSTNPFEPDSSCDLYLLKTDDTGNLLWERTYGDSLWECGRHVEPALDGGYIIVGETESYGGGEMEYPDIYLLKVDNAGDQEWYRTFGGPGMDIGYWVEQTTDGGYIIAGQLDTCADMVLIRTDSLGNALWTRTYGTGCATGFCVRQTSDQGFIAAGADFDIPGPYFGGYLVKVDSLGSEEWCVHYDDTDAKTIYYLEQTSDGGFILTGIIGDGDNFDIFLKKIFVDGSDEWTRYFDFGHWDFAYCVEQTLDGGYILAGSIDVRNPGFPDVYVLKTDPSGEREWDLELGGANADMAKCIQQTTDGGFICCGSTVNGDPPNDDVWLIRLESEGVPVIKPDGPQPSSFTLYPAYPNPFNSSVIIQYSNLSGSEIGIYDIQGKLIRTFGTEEGSDGKVIWDATDYSGKAVSSGIYFARARMSRGEKIIRLVLLR